MKKNILYLLIGLSITFITSCQDPEDVGVDTTRQGVTSLTAIFTSGPYKESEAVSHKIFADEYNTDRFVIPVPWFFPESSDNETEQYMKAMRVKAELNNNYVITPKITILDLTKDNYFTLTAPDGSKREICITGQRTKSAACQMITFGLKNPELTGVIDQSTKTISLISADDLSSCLADFEVSAHATISPDPSTTQLNYNDPVELTVTAHNGVDKQVYTVKKNIPAKIPYGFSASSVEQLFNVDPTAILGIPWLSSNAPTLGAINNNLVVCMGDGTEPMYFNRITGVKQGTLNLGSIKASSITSDEGNHLLICNHAEANETCNIYVTTAVNQTPTLFYSFTNTAGLPMGAKIKVIGDIQKDAIIILTNEGIDGVTSSSKFTRIVIKNGVIQQSAVVDISATGLSWGSAPVNSTSVVAASTNANDGNFLSYYDPNLFTYLNGSNTIANQLSNPSGNSWGENQNCLDSKQFNQANYVALLLVSHFPHWGIGPSLYVYDVNDKSKLTGDITSAPSLVLSNNSIAWFQAATAGTASGDVLIAPTADGFKMYIYYYDNNSGVIGAYVADCIDKQ